MYAEMTQKEKAVRNRLKGAVDNLPDDMLLEVDYNHKLKLWRYKGDGGSELLDEIDAPIL